MQNQEFFLYDIWNKFLLKLEQSEQVGQDLISIFRDSSLYSLTTDKAIIHAYTFINFSLMNTNIKLIKFVLSEVLDKEVEVDIIFRKEEDIIKQNENTIYKSKLNPQYTFTNFVIGKSNKEAQFSAFFCANNPGLYYNPLFIYGKSGIGKSHLLNAIGNHITKNFPEKKVALIPSSDFIELVFECSKKGSLAELKKSFSKIDVLLVDDIQFIAGKEKTHEIFFSIFNELVSNNKQIVITADRKPDDIKGLEDRIISRFNSGLKMSIVEPEFETSVNIIKMKLLNFSELRHSISDEIINFIATNFSSDVRSLEGALNKILFHSINYSLNETITLKECREIFKDETLEVKNEITVDKIKDCVCNYYGLTRSQLIGKSRTSNISNARHISIYLCRKLLDLPFSKIGQEFGNRDHSTIMSSCDKIEKNIKNDMNYQIVVSELKKRLKPQ